MKVIKILYLLAFITTFITGFFNFEKCVYMDDFNNQPIYSIFGFKSVAFYTAILLILVLYGMGRVSNSVSGIALLIITGIIFYILTGIISTIGTFHKPPGAMVQGGIGILILIIPFSHVIIAGTLNSLYNQSSNSDGL